MSLATNVKRMKQGALIYGTRNCRAGLCYASLVCSLACERHPMKTKGINEIDACMVDYIRETNTRSRNGHLVQ